MTNSNESQNILLISLNAPYDGVGHAGGKTCNYYTKKLIAQGNKVTIIASAEKDEEEKIISDRNKYGYESYILYRKDASFVEWSMSIIKRLCPLTFSSGYVDKSYRRYVLNIVNKLYSNNSFEKMPDRIICDWTDSVAMIYELRRFFPRVDITAIEQDVTFQSYQRFYKSEKNPLRKLFLYIIYHNIKEFEIKILNKCDYVKVFNFKDRILLENKIPDSKLKQIAPYFDRFAEKKRYKSTDKNIIFYGAMYRRENYEAVIWFIENVFYKLDKSYKFYIIGNKPSLTLEKYRSNNVIITGFVQDISVYTENALCFVAPLLHGAGIKVKVLEAFAMGLPVLTNTIGIEGIAGKSQNKKIYMHCESSDDYIRNILLLDKDKTIAANIGIAAVQYVFSNFNYENCTY